MSETRNRARKITRLIRALERSFHDPFGPIPDAEMARVASTLSEGQWEMVAKIAGYRDGHVSGDTREDVVETLRLLP